MPLTHRLKALLQTLLHKNKIEQKLDAELQAHLDLLTQEKIRFGLSPAEARRTARIELGGIEQVKENVRNARSGAWLEFFFQDLRYGVRTLCKNPGFAAVAILTLALGIGANTAIFSVIDSVLLRPLPYNDPAQLVMVWERNLQLHSFRNTVSPPDFLDWRAQNHVFTGMAAMFDRRVNLTGNGTPEEVVVENVSVEFFDVLGVKPIFGPGFTPQNGQPGHDDVITLSYGFWKERFAAVPGIIGRTLVLNGHPHTVVGIMPQNFQFFVKDLSFTNSKPQIWTPFVAPANFSDRKQNGRFLSVVARLQPNETVSRAQTEMDVVAQRIAEQYPDFNGHWGINIVSVRDQISGEVRPALLILLGAVAFVLLIACANVSSLLLARASNREREMALRTAIGATRGRIARQLLTESLLLAVMGGCIGVALAVWGIDALLAASPKNLLDLRSISLDWSILAFAIGVTLIAGVLFGFLPSFVSAHSGIAASLKEGSRGLSSGKQRHLLRSGLVVAQICLALVLLAGSGLLIRSFIRLVGVDPGFDSSHLLTYKIALPPSKYQSDQPILAFYRQYLDRISHVPGVRSATTESFPPFSGLGSATGVHILSQPRQSLSDLPVAGVRVVGPDYFHTMQIPIVAGRDFTKQEMTEARHVVIINQAFAAKYLHGANPLRQQAVIFMKSLKEEDNIPSEIIGVAGDVRQIGLDSPAEPAIYWPQPELVMSGMTVLVRAASDPEALLPALRSELQQIDPEQPMSGAATMDQLLADSLSRSRFTMLLLGIFAALALVLASVGIYGVIAYSVTQRTQEFGIRMALGANQRDVLRIVLREGGLLVLLGLASGVVVALAVTHLMTTQLYDVTATDPLTFVAVAALLSAVALTACYIPARRALRVDPMVALRYE
jgi:putative ABC transport system permease protein